MPKQRNSGSSLAGSRGNFPALFLALTAALALVIGCAKPTEENKPAPETPGKHVYKDLKAEVYALPEAVIKALPGLLNDKIYLYREIAPTLNLVAYTPEYSREAAVKMSAEAFLALAPVPEFRKGVEFWIIQIQPMPEAEAKAAAGQSQVVVWGVRPGEVDAYQSSGDLGAFLQNSEYLLVDDKIIAKGPDRGKEFPGLGLAPAPAPLPGATATPAPGPQPGTTAPAPAPAPAPQPSPGTTAPTPPATPPGPAPVPGATPRPQP